MLAHIYENSCILKSVDLCLYNGRHTRNFGHVYKCMPMLVPMLVLAITDRRTEKRMLAITDRRGELQTA